MEQLNRTYFPIINRYGTAEYIQQLFSGTEQPTEQGSHPWERENMEGILTFIQFFCLSTFPNHGTKKWSLKTIILLGRENRPEFGNADATRICGGESFRRRSSMQKNSSRNLLRGPLTFVWMLNCTCVGWSHEGLLRAATRFWLVFIVGHIFLFFES